MIAVIMNQNLVSCIKP